jgi:hypothetical protein
LKERRLSGSVGADQTDDLASLHIQRDVVDGLQAAELDRDVDGGEKDLAAITLDRRRVAFAHGFISLRQVSLRMIARLLLHALDDRLG